jgi:PKD repeat protein
MQNATEVNEWLWQNDNDSDEEEQNTVPLNTIVGIYVQP